MKKTALSIRFSALNQILQLVTEGSPALTCYSFPFSDESFYVIKVSYENRNPHDYPIP